MMTKFYRNNHWKKNSKTNFGLDGLTLVELVVAVALLTILSAVIFTGMSYFLDVKVEVVQTADIRQNLKFIIPNKKRNPKRRRVGSWDRCRW